MPYNLTTTTGSPLVTVKDNSLDNTTTSLNLMGRNYNNFGLLLNENFIGLLQNWYNTAAPPNPLGGQLWFDAVSNELKVYSGTKWTSIMNPTSGSGGSYVASVGTNTVVVEISNSTIVSVTSLTPISRALLPNTIIINDTNYAFGTRFPLGISSGINLAVDNNHNYLFNGQAASATQLAKPMTLNLSGSVTGSTSFTGLSNATINTSLADLGVGGTYYQVRVSSNGIVTGGNVQINSNDIISSLGYDPLSLVTLVGDVNGSTVLNGNIATVNTTLQTINSAGTYTTVTVNDKGLVTSGLTQSVESALGYTPLSSVSLIGTVTGNTTVTSNIAVISTSLPNIVSAGTYGQVTVNSSGLVTGGSANALGSIIVGGIMLMSNELSVPSNYALCNGQTVTTTAGIIVTPNMTNVTVSGSQYVMRIS